jgi:anhydro-N-acetylmuramic acid kinase
MSGTSLDGVDIIYTQISKIRNDYNFNIIYAETIPYSKNWELLLRNAFESPKISIDNFSIEYGDYMGSCVLELLIKVKLKILIL